MSLEKAKTLLTVTKDQWLTALLNSNGDKDAAEKTLKNELKTKYDTIKKEKEFISVKANKKAVDEYYDAAKKAVSWIVPYPPRKRNLHRQGKFPFPAGVSKGRGL